MKHAAPSQATGPVFCGGSSETCTRSVWLALATQFALLSRRGCNHRAMSVASRGVGRVQSDERHRT